VLPFSYNGAVLTKPGPVFSFSGYSASDVANNSPGPGPNGKATVKGKEFEATVMNNEITSIHAVWPDARIVVVGHSNGGLIAEQWWLNYGAKNPSGVVQVFALDSPLNGERNHICSNTVTGWGCDKGFGVGKTLSDFYDMLWNNQAKNDAAAVALDSKDNLFTAIGTDGDPLYDFADAPPHSVHVKNGDVSQFFYPSSCAGDAYTPDCLPIGRWSIDPCGPLDDGLGPRFGIWGDLWMHSVVKNCTIPEIMKYIQ